MLNEADHKVTREHLLRDAWLYIRQSTLRQVFENTESTQRQYALQQRAIGLGWPAEQIHVIDTDLGRSGADSDRAGFQQLVTEVSLGRAGIVMGLEVSRLARNSTDWHRLLEICALTDTLILDEDGIYDPGLFNDRLLLGLKGTMSEAELHMLRARLHGGLLNAARRGELKMRLPIGLVYDDADQVVLDPDQHIQQALRLLFATFERTGSATATVKSFRKEGLQFPRRPHTGPGKGQLIWGDLVHSQVLNILHNPRYTGAFVYGRSRVQKTLSGPGRQRQIPQEQWQIVIKDKHPGYISWKEFEDHNQRLTVNARARGADRKQGPPREGEALLQGIVICGLCGNRMTIRYGYHSGQCVPHYMCQREGIEQAKRVCQHIPGASIDQAISSLLSELVTPIQLDVALAVEEEMKNRLQEATELRRQQVEQARYNAELAKRRYQRVDPDNRLVASSLEADWNNKLRQLQRAQEDYESKNRTDRITDQQKSEIRSLAKDFPLLWQHPKTPQKERKRLLRLLIEDVTLRRDDQLRLQIRFRGGRSKVLTLPRPQNSWELKQTEQKVIDAIDRLLGDLLDDDQIADTLNGEGYKSGWGKSFTRQIVYRLRQSYNLKSQYDRLRELGLLTREEMAQCLSISVSAVGTWRCRGMLSAWILSTKTHLYQRPDAAAFDRAGIPSNDKRRKHPDVPKNSVGV